MNIEDLDPEGKITLCRAFRVGGLKQCRIVQKDVGIGLNSLLYGVLYLGSHIIRGPI